MSKKRGGGDFNNLAAKKFKNPEKIDLMSQQEIFKILDEDIDTMLSQVTANREHKGAYPQYIANGFANISTAYWFFKYVKEHCTAKLKKKSGKRICVLKTDLDKDQIESLKTIISDAFKKSVSNKYAKQTQEFVDRNKLLLMTFRYLDPRVYHIARKGLGLKKTESAEVALQTYGNPAGNFRYLYRQLDKVDLSDKKRIRLLKTLYQDRFAKAIGAALTVDYNKSDTVSAIVDYVNNSKKKKRCKYILEYARAYKENGTTNFRLRDGRFYDKNRAIIKYLIKNDLGFKKAFKALKKKKTDDEKPEKKEKKEKKKKNKDKLPMIATVPPVTASAGGGDE